MHIDLKSMINSLRIEKITGIIPPLKDVFKINSPLLIFYAGLDTRIDEGKLV
jgi:hypothetical protein